MLRNPKKNENYVKQRFAQNSKDVQGFIDEIVEWKNKDIDVLFPAMDIHQAAARLMAAVVSVDIFQIKGTNIFIKLPTDVEPSEQIIAANEYLAKHKTLKPFLEPLKLLRERVSKFHTLTYNQKLDCIETVMDDLSTLLLRLELALNRTSWSQ